MKVVRTDSEGADLRARIAELTSENARLSNAQKLLERLVEQAPFSIQVLDADGRVVQINAAHERLIGMGREQYFATLKEDFRAYIRRSLPAAAAALDRVYRGEVVELPPFRYQAKVGPGGATAPLSERLAKGIYLATRAFPVRGADGEVAYVVVINEDVTERVRLEQERVESERRYRRLVENLYDAVIVFDEDRTISMWNSSATRIYGWPAEEAIGRPAQELLGTQADGKSPAEIMDLIFESGSWRGTLHQRTKEGRRIEVECSASHIPIMDSGRGGVVCVNRDVTEHKRLQAQLIQAQKMESIGTLAGGIAHEFNNMLSGILGYASLLSKRIVEPEVAKPLRIIQESATRGAKLTRQLLTFARKQEAQRERLSLNATVESSMSFLGQIIGKDVTLDVDLEPDLRLVLGDPWQLEQIVVNLCLNARDSMSGEGNIRLETRNVGLPETGSPPELASGHYVRLRVMDTGAGMKREVLDRIFEPFFTTKEQGHGTGLGLAVVYGIVKEHGGAITVRSEPGVGTTFDVFVPSADGPGADTRTTRPVELPRGHGVVLVVDDEVVIREMATEMLETIGYHAISARSGQEAVALLRELGSEIDLVLMDLLMPGMDGLETFRAMRAVQPRVRVIVSSGLVRDQLVQRVVEEGAVGFVGKPYDIQQLAETMAKARATV